MLIADIKKKLSSFTLEVHLKAEGRNALIGPSGCGKSVTLKCIAGIMKPDSGYIEYDGRVLFDSSKHINLPPQQRHIGYLFQNYALFPDMTVRENIMTGLKHEKNRSERQRKFDESVELLHISHILGSKPYQLSGGESQRVALARMIVNSPSLMLFDEPFSALDAFLRDELKAQFRSVMENIGYDYLIVTHSMDEAYSLSDTIYIIDNGRIIREGESADVFSNPGNRRAAEIIGYRNITKASSEEGLLIVPEWNIKRAWDGKPVLAVCIMEDDIKLGEKGVHGVIKTRVHSTDSVLLGVLPDGAKGLLWVRVHGCAPIENVEVFLSIPDEAIKALS